MSAPYAWRIHADHLKEDGGSAVNWFGPTDIDPRLGAQLLNGEGMPFRMLDDDRNLYYEGTVITFEEDYSDLEGFEPLDNFGTPYAGCTIIQYLNKDGNWEDL